MSIMVTICSIDSLEKFRDLILPVAQAEYERTARLPERPGHHYINLAPELTVALAADEFVRKLPREYVKRTTNPNDLLYSGRKVAISRTVPREVVIGTIRRMSILSLGDEKPAEVK